VTVQHTITFITHDLSPREESDLRNQLLQLGLVQLDSDLLNFVIWEHDAAWPEIDALQSRYRTIDICWTEYSARELSAAPWLRVRADWYHGYPMPDEGFEYLGATYDLSDYCKECGAGAVQRAPFRLRAEPRWGRRSILQLNWVFDEYFVRPELYEAVFRPLGIGAHQALHYRSLEPLETVVQVDAGGPEANLLLPIAPTEVCAQCGRLKYLPLRKTQPVLREDMIGMHIVRSRQLFGSGGAADRAVLVSQELYQRIKESKARGVSFAPVHLADHA
jgi:hypothetical protein